MKNKNNYKMNEIISNTDICHKIYIYIYIALNEVDMVIECDFILNYFLLKNS